MLIGSSGGLWIYRRAGTTWSRAGEIAAPDGVDHFPGGEISLSEDGRTLVASATTGSATSKEFGRRLFAFVRAGDTWVEQQEITSPFATNPAGTVAEDFHLSGDGNTLLVSWYNRDTKHFAGVVYTRNGAGWVEQRQLTSDVVPIGAALSRDANIAVVVHMAGKKSRPVIYERSGSTWRKRQDLQPLVGYAVFSKHGSTLIIAGYYPGSYLWRFDRSTKGAWAAVGKTVLPPGADIPMGLAVSANGSRLLVTTKSALSYVYAVHP
jgi:hypothetical protein